MELSCPNIKVSSYIFSKKFFYIFGNGTFLKELLFPKGTFRARKVKKDLL